MAAAAAEACVVTDVGMAERRPRNAAGLRQTVLVVVQPIVPAPCTETDRQTDGRTQTGLEKIMI